MIKILYMCIKRKINKKKTFFLMLRVPVILYFSWALEDFCQRVLSFFILNVFAHTTLFLFLCWVLFERTNCKQNAKSNNNNKIFSSCQILIVWEKKRKIRIKYMKKYYMFIFFSSLTLACVFNVSCVFLSFCCCCCSSPFAYSFELVCWLTWINRGIPNWNNDSDQNKSWSKESVGKWKKNVNSINKIVYLIKFSVMYIKKKLLLLQNFWK